MTRYCILALLGIGATASAQVAEAPSDSARSYVRLVDPPANAGLYAGDHREDWRLGDADGVYAVDVTTNRFSLIEEGEAWSPRRVTVELETPLPAGDTLTLDLRLPVRYRIATVPPGAEVAVERPGVGREVLGTAPLVVDRPAPLGGTLVASLPGHLEARAPAGDSAVNTVRLVLRPLTPAEGAAVDWRPVRRPRVWIDYAAAGLALASAAFAVHYKFQADEVDDRYRTPGSPERGDPALREEAERLDGYALAGLVGMQVGLGVLAFRLVLR